MQQPIISLITDFGDEDFFVGSLKGVIASINPQARILDITHGVPSFDITAGAFLLYAAYRYYPDQTVFLTVVDPGVGSERRILLFESQRYFFVAPDNGLLSLVLQQEKSCTVREVTNSDYFLDKTSKTFEARDKMAPVAAWISKGILTEKFGPIVSDCQKIGILEPVRKGDEVSGFILYRDKFGNLITNIPAAMVEAAEGLGSKACLETKERRELILPRKKNYSSAEKGEIFFLTGSLGLIEIAVREGSASDLTGVKPGDPVKIILKRT